MLLYHRADLARAGFNLLLVLALDHHAGEHFGAGVTHQDPPAALQPPFDRVDDSAATSRISLKGTRLRTFTLWSTWGKWLHCAQFSQRLARIEHVLEQQQSGDQAVAGG